MSIILCCRINYLLRQYEKLEKREDLLIEHLRKTDPYAFKEAVAIDKKQDKIIAEIWDISFQVGTENQKSNSFWQRYDPKHMQEVLEEKRKRAEAQTLLFKGGEVNEKRKCESMERGNEVPTERSDRGIPVFEEKIPNDILNLTWKEKSGRGIAVPHRS